MANKAYSFRFNEFLRGKLIFNDGCTQMLVLRATQPHVLELVQTKRGWRAYFGVVGEDVPSYWEINQTGTRIFFSPISTRRGVALRELKGR